jgi:hypothetical protein
MIDIKFIDSNKVSWTIQFGDHNSIKIINNSTGSFSVRYYSNVIEWESKDWAPLEVKKFCERLFKLKVYL